MRILSHILLATVTLAAAPAAAAPAQDSAFTALSKRYIDGIARLSPSYATLLGDHRFDDRVTDLSAAARARQIAFDKNMLTNLGHIDRSKLTRDNQVDAALLDNALRYDIWQIEILRNWAWDMQIYNDAAGTSLYSLAARDFAPWPQRLRSAIARMEAIPAMLAQARTEIEPARVPAIFASTVARQNSGIVDIAEGMLAPHKAELSPVDQKRFAAALTTLKQAVAEHQKWLETVLVPQAKGDFRLGAKLYDEKVRFALVSPLSRQEIKARATAALSDVRTQMYALARQALAGKADAPEMPDAPTAEQQQKAIEAALDLTYAQRPSRNGVMAAAEQALKRETEFVRAKALVSVPDSPVKIITMPRFQQGSAVAYCDSPGPLEKHLDTFFAISPIPDEWTDEQTTSFLREYNNYMIQDLSAHEAMPGHYLQIALANRDPSVLRAVLASGPFVEGWAVYGEGMMADANYMDGDPLFKLTVLKMRLRSITNSLLDIGIQAEGMTRDQAMTLMTKTGFQQEREAAGKWVRANLSSAQLLSYFVGYSEHMDMREEARKRLGPKFDLKTYNDAALSHGSPPVRFVRALMFGSKIE